MTIYLPPRDIAKVTVCEILGDLQEEQTLRHVRWFLNSTLSRILQIPCL